ncbi:MAG: tetraacyldisaccharide 4'-kinase [Deltaproteobacteria bacterium]|nr:MAG: tetraacyldisaccharide 4'-kinase [Deltaproteobacteria bacterium]
MINKHKTLFFFGRPVAPLYAGVMKIREWLYKSGFFERIQFPVPVVSVGNLMLGGTGKTPTVIHIARLLRNHGYRPAVVSRGYKGSSKAPYTLVSDGTMIISTADTAGDEAVMMAKQLSNIPILVGKKRAIPCRYAVESLEADCIILDDGFQHLAVARDIDLVLFDSTNLAGNSRVFPGGPLREQVSSLKRTSAFLLTGRTGANAKRADTFAELLQTRFTEIPVFSATYSEPFITDIKGKRVDARLLKRPFLFSAIANPERFVTSVSDLGLFVTDSTAFADHFSYSQKTAALLEAKAQDAEADCLLTTAKDAVKLEGLNFSRAVYVFHLQQSPGKDFDDYLLTTLKDLEEAQSKK